RQEVAISFCQPSAGGIPGFQVPQLNCKYRSLKTVHSVVVSHLIIEVPMGLSLISKPAGPISDFVIVCNHRATLSVSPKILARIEAETSDSADAAHTLPAIERAVSLTGILDHWDAELVRNSDYCSYVGGHAVQMDRNNCFSPLCDRFMKAIGI